MRGGLRCAKRGTERASKVVPEWENSGQPEEETTRLRGVAGELLIRPKKLAMGAAPKETGALHHKALGEHKKDSRSLTRKRDIHVLKPSGWKS